jgi:hypothetical protein
MFIQSLLAFYDNSKLLIPKIFPKAPTEFLAILLLSLVSLLQCTCHSRLFLITCGFRNLKAGTSFLNRATGSLFRIQRSKQKLYFIFYTRRQPNIVKTICADTKSTDLIFKTLKKYSSRAFLSVSSSGGLYNALNIDLYT